tara:strand:- start:13279 stop:14064 length:786 start_codon:yes stop_codon:yes gene_type:complete
MDPKIKKKIIYELIETFIYAGKVCLDLRKKGLKKTIKEDNTPVTNGDIEVNNIITKKIKELTPHIPIVSEEVSENKDTKNLSTFWLIDPIDGTYDYVNGKEEFTLNAGLIINKTPEIAVINAPAKKRLFYTFGMNDSFELKNNDKKIRLDSGLTSKNKNINALVYSDKINDEIKKVHKMYNIKHITKMKSSLKFCVVATGEYDLYVAEPRASEWDIAAGDAILKNAGGSIKDIDGNQIFYGKEKFKNPSIVLKSQRLIANE